MIIKFDDKRTLLELHPGLYNVYIIGGFYVRANENFRLVITNAITDDPVIVHKKLFRLRTFKNQKRAITYFDFNIEMSGNYEISVSGYYDIVVKRSMLWSLRLFAKPIDLINLGIFIEYE